MLEEPSGASKPLDAGAGYRAGMRVAVALTALLAVGSIAGFLLYEYRHVLEAATTLSERRAARLADDIGDTLVLAQVALTRIEARLDEQPPGAPVAALLATVVAEQQPLLAGLPMPFRVLPLGADGRLLTGAREAPDASDAPWPLPTAAGWQVEPTRGPPGNRHVPVLRQARANHHGVAAFVVELDHAALLARFEASRQPVDGGVALFRIDADGATQVLARAPHDEAELGRRVRGPLAAAVARSPRGTFDAMTQFDQTRRTIAFRRLEGDAASLVVAYGKSTDAVLAEWRSLLPWAAGAALLLLTAIGAGGRRLERALRVQAEQQQAMQRSESQFRSLADNLPDVVVRLDPQGRHRYANPAVQQATGLPPEAFIGKSNAELGMPADNVAQWTAALRRVFDSRQPERMEFTYPGPQGQRHWESTLALEPPVPGEPPTVLVISRDITQRRQDEQARAALHRRLADVLESMSDGFVSLDREWRYVAVNRKAGEMFGRDAAGLIGRHIWTEFPEGVDQPFHRAYERAMNEGEAIVMEEHYAPWGRWFENRIYPGADGISIFFTDITERRRTFEALQASEQRLRAAQQLAALGSWEVDLESGALTWSDEVFRIFEIDPARFGASYDAFLAAIHPDDRDAVNRAYRRSVDGHVGYALTHRLLLADGRIKHVHEQGRSFYADDGTPLRSVGTVQDVTARVQAEQALRDSEVSHREMFEANPHPMWVYDLATLRFLAVNDAAVRRYGYAREEFLAMTIKDIRPPEDVARLLANVAAVQDGIDEAGTWRHRARDGRLLEVEITSHTLRFEGRDAELVLAHDVTRRNQAERTLHDSEERLRLALQAANQGLYDLDLRSGDVVVSPEYARMLGWEPEDFQETNAFWRERLHPDDREAVYRVFEDYVAGRRSDYRVEFRQRVRDGGWKWILSIGRIQEHAADGTPLRMLGTHTDLDAIKAAQAAQLAASQRFEKLFQAAPEAISVSELDSGRLLQVNDAFCELFGHTREQAIGQTSVELGMWTDTHGRDAIVAQLHAGQPVRGFEGVARRRSGEAIDVLFSAERIDFDGIDGLLLMFRDISQRKRLEVALRVSEERLTHLLSRAPTVVYTARADADFAATYYSPNLPDLVGWQPQAFVEDSSFWLNHLHPDDRSGVLQTMETLATHDELVLEYRFQHADGGWRWMRDQVSVQRDAQGHATELVGAWIDITERRQAEEQVRRLAAELEQRVQERTAQLEQSEARYRTIFETVPVSIGEEDWSGVQRLLRGLRAQGVSDGPGYFATRPDFVHDCLRAVKVQRLNHKALALNDAGGPASAVPDLQAFFPGAADEAQFVGELEALWSGQRLFSAKRSLPSLRGRTLSLMMTMSLPGLDDDDGTALVCLVDITEIDRLNAELDQSVDRLRKVNRELETFTYSVSHDLKAPLRGIDGYSRLLLSDHHDRLDDEGRQFLQHIRQATQHMGALIDDLLAFSRLERRDLAIASMPLAGVVDAALAGFRQELAAAGAQVEVKVDAGLKARADAQGLTMALRNLIDNALKFSRARTPPRITIEATRAEDGVRLTVRDNGVGFDMKFHDRIFSIFQRLHRAEDYPGTGIGLAIVRKAMERMGGRVWAFSQVDLGATFMLELPEADST